jgi:hypothetical protein
VIFLSSSLFALESSHAGIVFARYAKQWRLELGGRKIWFIIHFTLQIVTLVIALTGMVAGPTFVNIIHLFII